MPKKSKRAKAKHRTRVAKIAQQARWQQPETISTEPPSPTQVSPKVQPPKVQDLSNRYQYVLPEVKRIGIIAGAIIVIIIILSFILG
jgi:hypothetical protein